MSMPEQLLSWNMLQPLAWTLVHSLWQGALIAGVLGLFLTVAGSRTRLRYAATAASMVLMLILPVVTFTSLSGAGGSGWGAVADQQISTRDASGASAPATVRPLSESGAPPVPAAVSPEASASGTHVLEASTTTASSRLQSAVNTFAPAAVITWLLGVLVLSLRLAGGYAVMQRLRRRGLSHAPSELETAFSRLARQLGVKRVPALRISGHVDVPLVLGVMKPLVLLPVTAASGLSALELELLLAHELAHVRRNDLLVNAMQRVAETVLFYHPAVWWISGVMRAEREHACDELAIRATGSDERHYVAALASLGEVRLQGNAFSAAASGGSLLARAERLLGRPGRSGATVTPLLVVLAAVLLMLPILARSEAAAPQGDGFTTLWVTLSGPLDIDTDAGRLVDIPGDTWILIEERFDDRLVRRALATGQHIDGSEASRLTTAPFSNVPVTYAYSPSEIPLKLHVEEGYGPDEGRHDAREWFEAALQRTVLDEATEFSRLHTGYSNGWSVTKQSDDRIETILFGAFWSFPDMLSSTRSRSMSPAVWTALAHHSVSHGFMDADVVARFARDLLEDEAALQDASERELALLTALAGEELSLPYNFMAGTNNAEGSSPTIRFELQVPDLEAVEGARWRVLDVDGNQVVAGAQLQVSRHYAWAPLDNATSVQTFVLEVEHDGGTERHSVTIDPADFLEPARNIRTEVDRGRTVLIWDAVSGARHYTVDVSVNDESKQIRTLDNRIDLLTALPELEAGDTVATTIQAHTSFPACADTCVRHSSSAQDVEVSY